MIFIDRYKAMKCDFNDIHDAIDFWHSQYKGDLELHEMLGLSFDEYKHFVEDENGFKQYLYNKYADFNEEFHDHFDDSSIDISDFLSWHHQNGESDYLKVTLNIEPVNYSDEDDDE